MGLGFAMDNSDSKKEKCSRTYRNFDGFLFLPAYFGTEGWMVNGHLLPGSQHPQKEFTHFLRETHARIRQICGKTLLYRKDSAHDSLDNRIELAGCRPLPPSNLPRPPPSMPANSTFLTHCFLI